VLTPATGALHQQAGFLQPPYDLAGAVDQHQKPVLVMFEQAHCAECDEPLSKFSVVLLDLWSDTPVRTPDTQSTTARDWARELNIQYAPSLVFFDTGGAEVLRSEAYLKAFHVQSVMDFVASGAYRTEAEFQRFIQARAEDLRERGIVVELME
jgi:thioredoxin-related protein